MATEFESIAAGPGRRPGRTRQSLVLAIVGMLFLSACGATDSHAGASAESMEGPTSPPSACASATPGESAFTVTSGGNDYDVRIFVPSSFDGSTTLPLVMDFHGYSSNGQQQARLSGYEELAETEGFIVVHPTGIPAGGDDANSWELIHFADDPAKDDVAFANDLLDVLIADYCVDETRVYVTGMSNGGQFTSRLVCDMADRLAAAASVSGTSHPDGCDPDRAVPYISYHGTADTVAPFDGSGETVLTEEGVLEEGAGTELFTQVIPEEFAQFAASMGCDRSGTREQLSTDIIATTYGGCDDDVPLIFYEIVDGGHLWPNTPLSDRLGDYRGYITTEIDATVDTWEFFEQHSLATS
jgi:polyhydroxybutyrate depolymerase